MTCTVDTHMAEINFWNFLQLSIKDLRTQMSLKAVDTNGSCKNVL